VKRNRLFFATIFLGCVIALSLSAQQPSSSDLPPDMSLMCKFTTGPRAGTFGNYEGRGVLPAPIGSPCHDGVDSTGIVVNLHPPDFERFDRDLRQILNSITKLFELKIVTSRVFAGPTQYPPENFASYGIISFPSRASIHDIDRHLMICNAHVTALTHSNELLSVPAKEQMITVWPINSDKISSTLNRPLDNSICDQAVKNYGLLLAQKALKEAELSGANTSGLGPYLLAWSPSTQKGKRDALVLVSDLSDVTTYQQTQAVFRQWIIDIEQDPSLWQKGWNMEKLRVKIRLWADMYGPKILAVFGGK
jgi:hypothetical protein